MKITVDLSKEEVKAIRDHLKFRMEWIMAGMDEKEPIDLILNKVLVASEEKKEQIK